MEHRKQGKKFSRKKEQRKALIKSLVSGLFLHGKIETTLDKAKETRRFAEKLISKAKKGDLSAKRRISGFLAEKISKKLIEEIAPKFKERKGGYTRIFRIGQRISDGAKKAIIELLK